MHYSPRHFEKKVDYSSIPYFAKAYLARIRGSMAGATIRLTSTKRIHD